MLPLGLPDRLAAERAFANRFLATRTLAIRTLANRFSAAAATDFGATVPLPVSERETANGGKEKVVVIDPEYVRQMVATIVKDQDLSRYIL